VHSLPHILSSNVVEREKNRIWKERRRTKLLYGIESQEIARYRKRRVKREGKGVNKESIGEARRESNEERERGEEGKQERA